MHMGAVQVGIFHFACIVRILYIIITNAPCFIVMLLI
jgi:hypothetical protein